MSEPEHVDPKQLRPGPIRNESFPPELLDQIKAVFDVIGPYISMTLEQFEIGFMRDMHPESEVALWFRITKAWLAYHEDFLGKRDTAERRRAEAAGRSDCDFHRHRRRVETQCAGRGWAQVDSVLRRPSRGSATSGVNMAYNRLYRE